MDLIGGLRAWALASPRVLVVDAPGGRALRWTVEAELDRRGWAQALSPSDADVLLVIGAPGRELTAAVDLVWRQMSRPRHRVDLLSEEDVEDCLARAARELATAAEPAEGSTPDVGAVQAESDRVAAMVHTRHEAASASVTGSDPPVHGEMDHSAHTGMDHSDMDHSTRAGMDHSDMDHSTHAGMDHSDMDHSTHAGMDHSDMDHSGHAGMGHSGSEGRDDSDMGHSAHGDMGHSAHEGMDHEGMDDPGRGDMGHAGSEGMDHEGMDHSAHEGMDHSAHEGMDHSAHEGMDHSGMGGMGGMDHSGHHMHHGGEVAGLPMAETGPDRDGLALDVLRVSLGPILPAWPTGLLLRAELQGDVLTGATLSWLDAGDHADADRGADPRRTALDHLASLLEVAGWSTAARDARRARNGLASPDPGEREAAERLAQRVAGRVRRSRALAWSLRGIGYLDGRHPGSDGDVLDRMRRWCDVASDGAASGPRVLPLDEVAAVLRGAEVAAARLIVASVEVRRSMMRVEPEVIGA